MTSSSSNGDPLAPSPPRYHERHRSPFLIETETTEVQQETELECKPYFINLDELHDNEYRHLRSVGLMHRETHDILLTREKHRAFLKRAFGTLSHSFVSLDSSHPWMLYWTLHSWDLLGELPYEDICVGIVHSIEACWQELTLEFTEQEASDDPFLSGTTVSAGGFGGGPDQMAHCAPTYAAVLTLSILSTQFTDVESRRLARDLLRRKRLPLYAWFRKLQEPNGAYRMHFDGEIDVRATYTLLCSASLLNMKTPYLTSNKVIDFLRRCQTFEGGFGGEPFSEAHGGYAFCAVAALELIGRIDAIDLPALRGWLARRQMAYEGGFQGRANKLVDGCYSFWQGSALAIVSKQYCGNDDEHLLFHEGLLQRYILLCAQDMNGGLRDKPSKPRDFYHSCYNLSGLSVSQHVCGGTIQFGHDEGTRLAKTDPVYNIRMDRVATMRELFSEPTP